MITWGIKFLLSFVFFFFIFCIPIKNQTFFDHLYDFSNPMITYVLDKINYDLKLAVRKTKNIGQKFVEKKSGEMKDKVYDELQFKGSAIEKELNQIKHYNNKPQEKILREEKKALNNIINK
jgi:hypothetical protein